LFLFFFVSLKDRFLDFLENKQFFNVLDSVIDLCFCKFVFPMYTLYYYYNIKDYFFMFYYFQKGSFLNSFALQPLMEIFNNYDALGDSLYSVNVRGRILREHYGKLYVWIR